MADICKKAGVNMGGIVMAKKTKLTLHPKYAIGEISPRLYGAFMEPIGTIVNGSMYNPKHPTADKQGFRRDFMDALREAGLPALRLPGGNFVSGWEWKDSIGPMEQRKAHLDLAWFQYIPNDVGHDEYLQWAEKIATEPMYTINLGTGTLQDAIHIAEYTNHPGGTYWSDLRRRYGREEPYQVKTWYLGNEMDGPWQIGSWEKDPKGYGVLANEVSKAMKWVDGRIETAVCASSSPFLDHYPQWDLEVLQECYNSVDFVSMHHYHSAAPGNYAQLLGGSAYIEDYINTEAALCDFVQAKMRSPRKLMLSFDEYGTMMRPLEGIRHPGWGPYNLYHTHYAFRPDRSYVRHDPDNMEQREFPIGDMADALGSASVLLAFLRHADRVKIGCMTRGLAALCRTDREHVWRSASYYPFHQLMEYGRGRSMQVVVEGETFDLPAYAVDDTSQYPEKEGLPFVDAAAAYDEENGTLAVFAINRDWENDTEVELDCSAFTGFRFVEAIQLYSDDLDAKNTFENPDRIQPAVNASAREEDGAVKATLKRLSWNVFRFEKEKEETV